MIERMVAQEIEGILTEYKPSIKEMVKTSLLPQLRDAVRQEIEESLGKLLEKSVETSRSPIPSMVNPDGGYSAIRNPKSAIVNPQSEIRNPKSQTGLYLYSIADGAETMDLGGIGLDGTRVYTVPFGDFSAVVHDCKAEPYQSEDRDRVKAWVLTHQKVVDAALEKFGAVIPMGFDTIISGKGDADPEENMRKWIETDYENLASKMAKIRGKAEYGVQIFWKTQAMARNVSEKSTEIKALEREIQTKPKGIAYMYRQKLEELLKHEMARKADQCFQEFYEKIKVHTDDLRVEKTKKADEEGRQMLLNLSCLLSKGQSEKLGQSLEEIDNREGFFVRYTGPWPPYSFV
ncbi:MAG: GvpL/GvpF family gas vesicle protein [Deltaproteobacteria bacterium]|nr:GvpL/GvpF family gas vesicle protein [Deltaproteobacteria bacterium]